MQTLYKRKSGANDDNIIPLINVVFLLLIFFMVAGKITPNHAGNVDLPVGESGLPATQKMIEIELDASGHIAMNGVLVAQEHLSAELGKALANQGNEAGLSVAIKADTRLEARYLTPVMNIIRVAGVEKIRLFTRSGDAA